MMVGVWRGTLSLWCVNGIGSNRKGITAMQEFEVYEAPDIVVEGDLEIQAGSPLGLPEDPFSLDDL